ncbi:MULTISPECIES: hypothetical protein [unclassified Sulfitobacter]|uniref:hypothetical protein n=1 Tax=unclassified Sulfitobacter TaxID=196795 RepID=UPI000564F497|nr:MULTISPECIES: hypothetical protein [unclassified Sulfitobacter]
MKLLHLVPQVILLSAVLGSSASSANCLAPERPFVPSDPQAAREYTDLIQNDFDIYIQDIQSYFRCLDGERARAFQEAREVSEEYGRFLGTLER